MRLSRTTTPSVEPITLAEAKLHLRVTWAKEDAIVDRLIAGARAAFERETGRQLLTATYEGFMDRFPQFDNEEFELETPPLVVVNSISYIDSAGAVQSWSASEYSAQVYSGPFARRGTLRPNPNAQYPITFPIPNAVTVDFDAGYGATAADVPDEIKQALLGWIGFHYVNREDTPADSWPGFDPWREHAFG